MYSPIIHILSDHRGERMTSPATLHHSYLYSNTLSHSMKRSNQWRNHLSLRTQHQPLSILHRLLLFKPILLIPTTTSLHPSSFFPSNTSYSSILPPSINTLYSIINPSFSNYSTITILLHPFYHYYWNTTTSLRSTSLTHQTQNGFSTLSSNSTPSTSLLLSFHVDERSGNRSYITSITPLVREERMVMNWLIFLLKAIREWYWMNTNGILCESKQFKWNESVRFHWIWFVVWVDEL